MTVPPGALDAAYAAAGQSLADPAGVRRCGDLIRLALEAAAPLIAAAQREADAQLAEQQAASIDTDHERPVSAPVRAATLREFADLLREAP